MTSRIGVFGFVIAALLCLASVPASAERRVALVLGNAAYQNAPSLDNPVNDATLMTRTFKDAGFDVVVSRQNLSALETRRALRDFSDAARTADIAVVYYAGHGIEVEGGNYLIPVDARLERDSDVYDEAFSLDRILLAIEPAKQLRLVILDACRDNPFTKSMKRTMAQRSIGRGLAKIEPTMPNTLIAYAAKAGFTAQDGDGKNSPFAAALAKHLITPGLDVRRAFGFVRDDVMKVTGNKQEPFVYGSLGGDDLPLVQGQRAPQVAAAPAVAANPQADVRRDYELALQIGNRAALAAFLAQHPDGFYANLAKLQVEKIAAEEAHATAAEKARAADAERARLAAEGARKEQQAKAEAAAKAAEQAQQAAEKAKQAAQQQAADAERKRTEVAAAAVDNSATRSPSLGDRGPVVAALPPAPAPADLTKSLEGELRRVGCLTEEADGTWNATSQKSLGLFNRYAGTKFDTKAASAEALDAIKLKSARVCPLTCNYGFKASGDRCVKIVCAEGSFLNDDNECEKRRSKPPVAKREEPRPAERTPAPTGWRPPSQGATTGQIVCDDHLCRPVRRGCRIEYGGQRKATGGNEEVCN